MTQDRITPPAASQLGYERSLFPLQFCSLCRREIQGGLLQKFERPISDCGEQISPRCMLQRPYEQVGHALLITSEAKGIGKSTLGNIVRRLEQNSRVPQTKDLKAQFDSWHICKLVVQVDEVYEAGNWDLANKLKPLITERDASSLVREMTGDRIRPTVPKQGFPSFLGSPIQSASTPWALPAAPSGF
jgi:Family of unknown function (DUF5906)